MSQENADNSYAITDDKEKNISEQNSKEKSAFAKQLGKIVEVIMNLRIMRALARYGTNRGSLLSGGLAYTALFSILSALMLGISILGLALGSNKDMRISVYESIDKNLPGILTLPGKTGILDPEDMVMNTNFALPSIIAIVLVVLTVIGLINEIKTSILAMFNLPLISQGFVKDKLNGLIGLLTLFMGIILTTAVGIISTGVGTQLLASIGLKSDFMQTLLSVVTLALNGVIDALVLFVLVKVVAKVNIPRPDLLLGLTIFAIANGILRYLGTSLVAGSATGNPLIAPFAAIGILLVWINLLARVTLTSCAFMANPPRVKPKNEYADQTPNYVTLSDKATLEW